MKKYFKLVFAAIFAFTICISLVACGKNREQTSKSETSMPIDINTKESISTSASKEESSDESTAENITDESLIEEEPQTDANGVSYVPIGKKVSDDIPLNIVTFGSKGTSFEPYEVNISSCTLADLCETSKKMSPEYAIESSSEGMVTLDKYPELYLCTKSFELDGQYLDIETTVDGKVVTDASCYEPADSEYKNPNVTYSDMKIKSISMTRDTISKEKIAFCGGEIGYTTPKADVEKLLGKGREFNYGNKKLNVYKNSSATFAVKYVDGTSDSDKDSVEELYVFSNN